MPQWTQNRIQYQIFPDRFYRSETQNNSLQFSNWDCQPTNHNFFGGDLWGITEKLDYLIDLGINMIYLNPIFQSASNHRYHTYDYFQIDPLLGGNKAFETFLNKCHQSDIKVILDGVFNHVGRGFFAFHHLLECEKESPYINWFHAPDFPLNAYETHSSPNYQAWFNLHPLPKLNHNHPDVSQYIIDVGRYWLNFGIDGWRLDVPEEISFDFWKRFCKEMRLSHPDCYIVGEVWADEIQNSSTDWIQPELFNAVMNYGLTGAIISYLIGNELNQDLIKGQSHVFSNELNTSEMKVRLTHLNQIRSNENRHHQMNLLDSHDTARFIRLAHQNTDLCQLAYTLLFAFPGIPSLYYGSEVGLDGGRDPDCRRPMPWNDQSYNKNLLNHIRRLIQLKKTRPEWQTGSFEVLDLTDNSDTLLFKRSLDSKQISLVFILKESCLLNHSFEIKNFNPEKKKWTCALTDTTLSYNGTHWTLNTESDITGPLSLIFI